MAGMVVRVWEFRGVDSIELPLRPTAVKGLVLISRYGALEDKVDKEKNCDMIV